MSYTISAPGAGGTFLDGSAGTIPSRTEAAAEAIRHAILAGEMKPGQSLVEADLAQRLGVSKTPVREALKTLAGSGLVTMSPYRDAAVRVIDAATAAALLAATAALAGADAAGSDAERSLANREFHRALYAGCGNPLLAATLDSLRDQTALMSAVAWRQEEQQATGPAAGPDGGRPVLGWQREAAEHRAILAAAAHGGAGLAERLLREHISQFAARHFPGRKETP